jgi:hypothetical protein
MCLVVKFKATKVSDYWKSAMNDPNPRADPVLVLTPWQARLFGAIADAKDEVLIVSPYIKFGIATKVRGASSRPDIRFRTITRFKEGDFAAGASDIDAVWSLSHIGGGLGYEARFNNILHAKIYIIDSTLAFIGSSNLTFSGLMRNQEACVQFDDRSFIRTLKRQFEAMWELAGELSHQSFSDMIALLRSSRVPSVRKEEHFYDVRTPIEFFGNSQAPPPR